MKMANPMRHEEKEDLRHLAKTKRKKISPERRKEAEEKAFQKLSLLCQGHKHILSYVPFLDELNITALNGLLAKEERLALPRIERDVLLLYSVTNLEQQLVPHRWGLFEPDPKKCSPIDPITVDLALIPGLAFSLTQHRLGYGRGFYDRLLHTLSSKTIGIGFQEQFFFSIPREEHDIPLSEILLF